MNNSTGRGVVYLVAGASIFVILFGIRGSAYILNPILLAAVITITVLPIPGRLKNRGLPGWLSLVSTILVVVLMLGLVIFVMFLSVTALGADLQTYLDDGSQQTTAETTSTDSASTDPASTDVASTDTSSEPSNTTVQIGEISQSVIESVVNLLVQFGWALVIFFFMISAAIALPRPSRLGLDPSHSAVGKLSSITEDVRKYMTVLTGVNFLVGLGDTLFLLVLGVDYAILWGLLAWFMGYIPSIGFMIALVPPVLLAYAEYGVQTAIVVLLGYILINGGVQNFIQPKIMGQGLKINPVVVFVGLFIWGYLLGGIGALLAVPLTLLVLTVMDNFEGTRPLAILMRYIGEEKAEERKVAAENVKGRWGKVKGAFKPDRNSDHVDE